LKTRKIDGQHLPASAFAYVGNDEDTSTWKLPIHFPSDSRKNINHIKNALARFAETKGIPGSALPEVAQKILGAATAHGIKVDARKLYNIGTKTANTVTVTAATKEIQEEEIEHRNAEAMDDLAAEKFCERMAAELEDAESEAQWRADTQQKLKELIAQ